MLNKRVLPAMLHIALFSMYCGNAIDLTPHKQKGSAGARYPLSSSGHARELGSFEELANSLDNPQANRNPVSSVGHFPPATPSLQQKLENEALQSSASSPSPSPSPSPLSSSMSSLASQASLVGSELSRSISGSPASFVVEHHPLPLSVEVLYGDAISKQPNLSRLANNTNPEFTKWCTERNAFWDAYQVAQRRVKEKEEGLKKKRETAQSDGVSTEQLAESQPQSPTSTSYITKINQKIGWLKPEEHVQIIGLAEEKLKDARKNFEKLHAKAQAMHPHLNQDQLDRFAYNPLNPRQPYFLMPVERVKGFTLSPLDLIIAISMLEGFSDNIPSIYRAKRPFPCSNKRLENTNEALNILWTIYQRELIKNVNSWTSFASWMNWYNLNTEDGPLNAVRRELQKKFPYRPLTQLDRDMSTYEGVVLAYLNRDERGKILWNSVLKYIRKFHDSLRHGSARSVDEQKLLAQEYQKLPKHFHLDGTPVSSEQMRYWSDSGNASFEKVYTGLDLLTPHDYEQNGIIQSFVKIKARRFAFKKDELASPFVPVKEFLPPILEDTVVSFYHHIPEDYQTYMTELDSMEDTVAYETMKGDVVPNPLADKLSKTPNKFARMAREFRSVTAMEFHRNFWYGILYEIHNRKPTMIGVADTGLHRPSEPRPMGEYPTYNHDFVLTKLYKEAFARNRNLLQGNKAILEKLMQKQGTFTYLPIAFEFVPLTKHVKPVLISQETLLQPFQTTKLSVNNEHLVDSDLQKTHRTPTGRRNIFSYAAELNLSTNDLENPRFDSQMTALTDLNLSRNRIKGLEGIRGVLTQLVALNLSGNDIIDIPFIHSANLPMVRLDISSNLMTTLPSILQFTNLQELNVTGNIVKTLLPLKTLQQLTRLLAQNCGLKGSWEDVIPALLSLKMLNVNSNPDLFLAEPYMKSVSSSSSSSANNAKFNERFPMLEILNAGGKELKAVKEVTKPDGEIVTRAKPITLSDLRRIAP